MKGMMWESSRQRSRLVAFSSHPSPSTWGISGSMGTMLMDAAAEVSSAEFSIFFSNVAILLSISDCGLSGGCQCVSECQGRAVLNTGDRGHNSRALGMISKKVKSRCSTGHAVFGFMWLPVTDNQPGRGDLDGREREEMLRLRLIFSIP